jgi:HEAT repeat protein
VRLIAADRSVPLPQAIVDLIGRGTPPLRLAAIEALAARRDEGATALLAVAAYDVDLSVRLAAIDALGRLGGDDAVRELRALLAQGKTRIQEGAVLALGAAGDFDSVRRAATHDDWRVRRAAAEALAGDSGEGALAAAAELLRDRSGDVQLKMVEALDRWPLERGGSLLLAASAAAQLPVRTTAFRSLARRWPPAEQLRQQFEAPSSPAATQAGLQAEAERRGELLARLTLDWRAEFGQPPAASTTAYVAAPLSAEEISVERPDVAAARLASPLAAERFAALRQLAPLGGRGPLPDDVLSQLAQAAARETELVNWQLLLEAVGRSTGASADAVVHAALGHPAPEISTRACRLLVERGSPWAAPGLIALLDAQSPEVVVAALDALSRCRQLDDTAPLMRLLAGRNHLLRAEAALALARLGMPEGSAALERLTYDPDLAVRRRAVLAMGELRDPLFLDLLVAQLDWRNDASIRRAALIALPQVVGFDAADVADGELAAGDEVAAADAMATGTETRDSAAPGDQSREQRWQRWYSAGGRG